MNMNTSCNGEESDQLKRGPWTHEEDSLLISYINCHGEGRWNSLAKSAGLKRTGKSCRLRWLNYLKPDTKRGNLTPQEQLVILQLHSKLGNRWSKIARHLPGRTDNEIKNYWRTRVQKQARHLKIDSSSTRFAEALHQFWMPRLLEKIEQTSSSSSSSISSSSSSISTATASNLTIETNKLTKLHNHPQTEKNIFPSSSSPVPQPNNINMINSSSRICEVPEVSEMYGDTGTYSMDMIHMNDQLEMVNYFRLEENEWLRSGDMVADTYWNMDELW